MSFLVECQEIPVWDKFNQLLLVNMLSHRYAVGTVYFTLFGTQSDCYQNHKLRFVCHGKEDICMEGKVNMKSLNACFSRHKDHTLLDSTKLSETYNMHKILFAKFMEHCQFSIDPFFDPAYCCRRMLDTPTPDKIRYKSCLGLEDAIFDQEHSSSNRIVFISKAPLSDCPRISTPFSSRSRDHNVC